MKNSNENRELPHAGALSNEQTSMHQRGVVQVSDLQRTVARTPGPMPCGTVRELWASQLGVRCAGQTQAY